MSRIPDATLQEMTDFLRGQFGSEPDEFDIAEAVYWFGYSWHSGSSSPLYEAMCECGYQPGPCSNGPEKGAFSDLLLDALVTEFAGKRFPWKTNPQQLPNRN